MFLFKGIHIKGICIRIEINEAEMKFQINNKILQLGRP